MRVLSLFSGVGGFDLGLERAGMTIAATCEIDPRARQVLAEHFPSAKAHDTILNLDARPYRGAIDVVCGGFPCQDLSVAGRRSGLAGARSGLFHEACRVIRESTPRWVVIENVPDLLSSNGGRDMLAVLSRLAELGYVGAYRVLDSQHFGVPQRRRRVFIVGHIAGPESGRAAQVLLEPEGLPGHTQEAEGAKKDHPGGAGGGAGGGGARAGRVTGTLAASDVRGCSGNELDFCIPVAASGINGVRYLTPVECERLQGFPDGWTEGFPKTVRYRMMGNAVTVNVAEWIGKRIMAAEGNANG